MYNIGLIYLIYEKHMEGYMDLKQLRYFLTICEEGQITAAAKKLHMAQPPLSQQLKALEEELGVTLVKRGNRNIILTEAGEFLKEKAIQVLQECEEIKLEINDGTRNLKKNLRIGVVPSSQAIFLNSGIQEFHRTYPNTSFDIYEGNTFQIMELLEKGIVEIGVVRTPFPHSRYHMQKISKEPMVAVVLKNKNPFSKKELHIQDLLNKEIVCYERYEKLLSEIFIENGFSLEILCRNQDARTTISWAKAGLGIGIVPQSSTSMISTNDLEILPILDERLYTDIAMITIKERYLSDTASKFFNFYSKSST